MVRRESVQVFIFVRGGELGERHLAILCYVLKWLFKRKNAPNVSLVPRLGGGGGWGGGEFSVKINKTPCYV